MRIFSKFTDYYDHVVPPSDNFVWERKQTEINLDLTKPSEISKDKTEFLINIFTTMPKPKISYGWKRWNPLHNDLFILGFCGKLYAIYLIYTSEYAKPTICRPFININEFVEVWNKERTDKIKFEKGKVWHERRPFNEEGLKAWFDESNGRNFVSELFIDLKTPLFVIDKDKLTTNIKMAEYGLQRIFDPWSAYQEIEMYLTNNLASVHKEMPNFGNELKRDAHGFDDWSFKQVGPKPRKRK